MVEKDETPCFYKDYRRDWYCSCSNAYMTTGGIYCPDCGKCTPHEIDWLSYTTGWIGG